MVWGRGSLALKPRTLHLQAWSLGFNPWKQKSTNSQIWIRIQELSWDYWHAKILTEIAHTIITSLKFDPSTISAEFGHFARVLIDIDLSKLPLELLLFNHKGLKFYIYFEYVICLLFVQFVPPWDIYLQLSFNLS